MPRILPSFGRTPLTSPPKPRDLQQSEKSHAEEGATSSTRFLADRWPSTNMDLLGLAKEKRRSLAERPPSRKASTPKAGVPASKPAPARLDIEVQSPPLVFYGTPEHSTGAIMSGLLKLAVPERAEIRVESFDMELLLKTSFAKPVSKDCPDCASRTREVRRWDLLKAPMPLPTGTHSFPFSHLLTGDLPTSTTTKLGSISYSLLATARLADGETVKLVHPLEVKRALPEPQVPRTSQRIFPPTNLKTELEHPTLIYPIGQFTCPFRLTGILNSDRHAEFRWGLRRLTWTLNENVKVTSYPCDRHAARIGGACKAGAHTKSRAIGSDDLKGGWKTDFSPSAASVEMEISMSVNPAKKPVCDVNDPQDGIAVSHTLTVELIVAEEVRGGRGNSWVPTGTARVLRTQHHILMSERTGMGISWDEEQPPMYEDVPESPPWYPQDTRNPPAPDLSTVPSRSTQMLDYTGEVPPLEDSGLDLRR